MITDLTQLDPNGRYTYADYLGWEFEGRVELIKGKLVEMPTAQRASHQKALSHFVRDLYPHFLEKPV